MHGLGRLFDIGSLCVPTDAVAGAVTGPRIYMGDAGGLTVVLIATGTSTDILDTDLNEHTASTGGVSQDLDVIAEYWKKDEATLDNDETWTRVTQTAASEITNAGTASQELLLVFEVEASAMSDGFRYLSVNIPDLGTNATMHVAGLYILRDLKYPRKPANMPAPLR